MSNARNLADSAVIINFTDGLTSNVQNQLGNKQEYDANLTSFVTSFTLPTTDGTNAQVLSTDGGGNLTFSTVQAYNANLTSFVTTFTLPTTDGTANQFMKTDGVGNIIFSSSIDGGTA